MKSSDAYILYLFVQKLFKIPNLFSDPQILFYLKDITFIMSLC